jgi:hypothetical protein
VFQNPVESRFKNITKRKIKAFVDPIHISGPPSWTQAVANLLTMIIEGRGSEKLKIISSPPDRHRSLHSDCGEIGPIRLSKARLATGSSKPWPLSELMGRSRYLTSGSIRCGQGQNRTGDTRIFSPHAVAGLCVSIGRYWYLFKRLTAVSAGRCYRFEPIVTYSSGKVVAK